MFAQRDHFEGAGMKRIGGHWIFAAILQLMLLAAFTSAAAQEKAADQTFDGLAAEGAALVAADPRARALRNQQVDEDARHGFDIGMGWASRDRQSRPGRRRIQDALPPAERVGFDSAIQFSAEQSAPRGGGQGRP
jgi:hypothetical protein